jgi:GntR family transcriptional regulator/MocR family aminotransferase
MRRMHRIYGERRQLLLAGLRGLCSDWLTPLPAMAGLHIAARLRDGARR